MAPSNGNPYVGSMAGECQRLSQCILDELDVYKRQMYMWNDYLLFLEE